MAQEQKETIITLAIIAVCLLLVGVYTWYVTSRKQADDQPISAAIKSLKTSNTASYTDLQGNPLSLDAYIGTVIVVNSWASWSPESAAELKRLASLSKQFTNKNVKVLGINRSESRITAERFLTAMGVADDIELVLDPADHFFKSINGYAMPETVFFDASGAITHQQHGSLSIEQMVMYTNKALAVGME